MIFSSDFSDTLEAEIIRLNYYNERLTNTIKELKDEIKILQDRINVYEPKPPTISELRKHIKSLSSGEILRNKDAT